MNQDDSRHELADRVEQALRAMWAGDSEAVDRLAAGSEPSAARIGQLFAELLKSESTVAFSLSLLGDAIPRYRILREVGRGGMGVVFEAVQKHTKQRTALKVLLDGPFASSSAQVRFAREVELAAKLRHPRIVRVLESDVLPSGHRYCAMEFVEGETLDLHLRRRNPSPGATVELFQLVADAVGHAHRCGIVHRDLKPANVLVDPSGEPHILDFGLAKAVESMSEDRQPTISVAGQVLGTLRYLSPEQAAGQAHVPDPRTDVYSLGVMLYEALAGQPPYEVQGSSTRIIRSIIEEPPRRFAALGRRIDADLEAIVLKALEKEPARRYADAGEFADDLGRYLRHEPISARPPSRLYTARMALYRHRRRVAVAVLVLVAAGFSAWGAVTWQERIDRKEYALRAAAARRECVRIQGCLEAGLLIEDYLGGAAALPDQYPEIPETWLVSAQALVRLAWQRQSNAKLADALGTLRWGEARSSAPWSCRMLMAEIERAGMTPPPESAASATLGLAEGPDTAEGWYVRSFTTLDPRAARKAAEEAFARDPHHALAACRLTRLCALLGDYSKAFELAERLAVQDADKTTWLNFQGEMLIRQGRYTDAVDRYDAVLRVDPANREALRRRGLAYLCLRDYPRAAEGYQAASRACGGQALWEDYCLATPLWILGDLEGAAAAYRLVREKRRVASLATARLFLVLSDAAATAADPAKAEQIRIGAAATLDTDRQTSIKGSLLAQVLDCLSGRTTPEALVAWAAARENPDGPLVCQACYYAGERCRLEGRMEAAWNCFDRCIRTGVQFDPEAPSLDPMNEYHLALWRRDMLATARPSATAAVE